MRLSYLLLIPALAGSGVAFAEDNRPVGECGENEWCLPAIPHDGACPHPAVVFDEHIRGFRYESPPVSRDDESRCIPHAKPFVERRADELLLTFGDGSVKTYKDTPGECEGTECKRHIFYDYFPGTPAVPHQCRPRRVPALAADQPIGRQRRKNRRPALVFAG